MGSGPDRQAVTRWRYFRAPRNSLTICCSSSGVASAGSIGSPTASVSRLITPFWIGRGQRASLARENTLPHNPRNAIGITGAGVRRMISVTPWRNGFISPVFVSLPSGKMQTRSPSASASAQRS